MARNLYNEYYESIYEKAEKMTLELLNSKKFYFEAYFKHMSCDTKKHAGFKMKWLAENPRLSRVKGVYLIGMTKDNKDYYLYLGETINIYLRLYRFIKETFGKSRLDENHPAGKKYRQEYGRGHSENFFIKVLPCENHKEVEKELIRIIKPRYNVI